MLTHSEKLRAYCVFYHTSIACSIQKLLSVLDHAMLTFSAFPYFPSLESLRVRRFLTLYGGEGWLLDRALSMFISAICAKRLAITISQHIKVSDSDTKSKLFLMIKYYDFYTQTLSFDNFSRL